MSGHVISAMWLLMRSVAGRKLTIDSFCIPIWRHEMILLSVLFTKLRQDMSSWLQLKLFEVVVMLLFCFRLLL